ncbi:MAG TPA: LON peptidase substrate-binding domain-containing protein [Stellaceae bacterium]|nr:LON peptidase substrate-binding domain-containing protein [Stellaceae bacterium]
MTGSKLDVLRLPETLPIFPLSGALLLPGGRLPLNVFEARYLAMTDDALAGDRMIGMIQPADPESAEFNPPLQKTGCAGRITAFMEEGSRYLITLTGICRFDVASEQPTERGYRRAVPDWRAWAGDFETDEVKLDRPRLVAGFKRLFQRHGIETDWKAIEQAPDARLVSLLAMIAPFGPVEKQGLLLARTTADRAKLLIGLVEMALAEVPAELRH